MSVRYSKLRDYTRKAFIMAWGLKTFICTLKDVNFGTMSGIISIQKMIQILSCKSINICRFYPRGIFNDHTIQLRCLIYSGLKSYFPT